MATRYKYELPKQWKKSNCPQCRQRTFVPYVYSGTRTAVNADVFGRCDRENNCGYNQYPKGYDVPLNVERVEYKPRPTDYVADELVRQTMVRYEEQTLFQYLCTIFDAEAVRSAFLRYKVGTARNGGTIWWQVDEDGKAHTGKIMHYLPNGHRNKQSFGTWVHCKVKEDFNLEQCLFGLHLVTDGARVAVCESEKTAVCMSIVRPEFIWLATGGSHNTQPTKFAPLMRTHCDITFFADRGMFREWANKTQGIGSMSYELEKTDIFEGADIWDLVEKQL